VGHKVVPAKFYFATEQRAALCVTKTGANLRDFAKC
jgi:hypothetical protein